MSLTYRDVAEIMKIIDASSMDEVILEIDGAKLVVRRGAPGTNGAGTPAASADATPSARSAPAQSPASAAPAPAAPSAAPDADGETVRAPMVGTFYRSPSPGEPPFVDVGTTVATGDPLCLIEVMKLYTTVEATAAGTIDAVLAEDATLVEFDQPLFVIRPDGAG